MTTRLQLRTALRERLEDTSGSPLWADAALNEALVEAVRQYGVRLPTQATSTVAIIAGTSDYALPAGAVSARIVQVVDGDGDVIGADTSPVGPGPANASGYEQGWYVFSGRLYLIRKPGTSETWTLRYWAGRELVADDVTSQPIDAGDEPIVLELAAAWAYERRGIEDAKRGATDRFSRWERRALERADDLIAARLRRARGSVMA